MIREKLNGFLTLKDIVYWIAIMVALIGPYMIHERRIADMAADISLLKFQVTEIGRRLDNLKINWIEPNPQ